MKINWMYIGIAAVALIVVSGVVYYMLLPTGELVSTAPTTVDFGSSGERAGEGTSGQGGVGAGTVNEPVPISEENLKERVFRINDGPVAGAILIQTTHPTTTLVRFMLAQNGRVFDLPLDVSGALPRAVSNITIPGIARVLWLPDGSGALAQYESSGVRKTVFVGLLSATTTLSAAANPQPTKIQYLPDNVIDVAVSPDGKNVSYLLSTAAGADGYVALADGRDSKKLFSTPLSQVHISWPSSGTLLMQTRAAAGTLGAAFSIDARTGSMSTLFFATALHAIADRAFSKIIYQAELADETLASFSHSLARNTDVGLSLNPLPEKCAWSNISTSTLYCATPLEFVPSNFPDLWILGTASAPDSLLSFDTVAGKSRVYAIPEEEGGVASDIVELSVSPDDKYFSFIKKGERSLWGVRGE